MLMNMLTICFENEYAKEIQCQLRAIQPIGLNERRRRAKNAVPRATLTQKNTRPIAISADEFCNIFRIFWKTNENKEMCHTSLEISNIRLLGDLSKRGVVSQKKLQRPFKWNLSIFCLNCYFSLQSKVIFNINAFFNSHYIHLSNDVYNFILA